MLWGDRNVRYWRVIEQKSEPNPDNLADSDQFMLKRRRGRTRILNNKDPEGVVLFKSMFIFFLNIRFYLYFFS